VGHLFFVCILHENARVPAARCRHRRFSGVVVIAIAADDFCRGGERGHHVIRETRPSQELDGAGGDQIVDPEDRRPTFTDADPGRSNFRPVLEVDRGQIENHQERRDQKTYHGHGSRRLGRLHARRAIAHDQDVLLRRSRGLRRHRQAVRDDAKDQVYVLRLFSLFYS